MGQYHIVVNLDKQEYIHPHDLGYGLKQHEHTGFATSVSDIIYGLISTSTGEGLGDWEPIPGYAGRWVNDRVIVLGDYTNDSMIPVQTFNGVDVFGSDLYAYVQEKFTNISSLCKNAIRTIFESELEYQTQLRADAANWRESGLANVGG